MSGIVQRVPTLSSLTDAPRAAPLVERESELAVIGRAIAAAEGGTGQTIVVEAPAGLGKTALLDAAEQQARAAGWLVRRAAHGPRERHFPYGIVRTLLEAPLNDMDSAEREQALAGRGRAAARLLLHGESPPDEAAIAIGHSVVWLCAALADRRPMALLVDDAQWADPESLKVLSYLARRISDVPILLFVTARAFLTDWDPDAVGMLGGVEGAVVLTPQPLSRGGTGEVVRRGAPGAPAEHCDRCHASAAGNPWLVIELARQLALGGPDALDDPATHGLPLSPDARLRFRRRLADLSPANRAVIDALAILGRDADHHTVSTIVGPGAGDITAARGWLAAFGICAPDRWRLAHPLLRAAVLAEITPFERERLHREAARVLQEDGAPEEVVVWHLLRCGPAQDGASSAVLQRAATQAAEGGDPERAATLVARALDERAPGDDRAAILALLGTTAFHAGKDAHHVLHQALAVSGDEETRVEILQRLGALQAIQPTGASLGGVLQAGEQVEGDPELERAAEMAALDALLTHTDRHAERASRVLAIDPQAVPAGELRACALAHRAWLGAETGMFDASTCAELAQAALAGDVLLSLADRRAGFHLCVRVLLVTDRIEEAEQAIDALRGAAQEQGSAVLTAMAAWYAGELALCVGRLADAGREATRVLELLPEAGLVTAAATEVLVWSLAERGDVATAHDVLRRRPEMWEGSHGWETGVRHARACVFLAEGDYERAADCAREVGARRLAQGRGNPAWTPWRSTLAMALAHLGRLDEAIAVADENVALAHAFGAPTPLMTALLARTVCEPPGEQRAARAAAALEIQAPSVIERVQLQIELGSMLVRLGRRVEARDALQPAFATADAAGAVILAERARRELVASGLRPRKAALDGVASLTPRQAQVCGLAAGGKSNREIAHELFLSVKTVETHLAASYEKLGVTGRGEMVSALAASP